MWGIPRFPTLADFFAAATALGFDRFELNHAVDSPLLDAGFRSLRDPAASLRAKLSQGGSAPARVREQMEGARSELARAAEAE